MQWSKHLLSYFTGIYKAVCDNFGFVDFADHCAFFVSIGSMLNKNVRFHQAY